MGQEQSGHTGSAGRGRGAEPSQAPLGCAVLSGQSEVFGVQTHMEPAVRTTLHCLADISTDLFYHRFLKVTFNADCFLNDP